MIRLCSLTSEFRRWEGGGWRREGNEDEEQEKEKKEECETLKRTEGGEPPECVQSLVQVKTWTLVHFPGPWSTSKWTKDRT